MKDLFKYLLILCLFPVMLACEEEREGDPDMPVDQETLMIAKQDENIRFMATAQTKEVGFVANTLWNAKVIGDGASEGWLTVSPTSGMQGNKTLDLTVTENTLDVARTLEVLLYTAEDSIIINVVQAVATDDNKYLAWGFELPIGDMFSYTRSYDWYIDQYNTGEFSSINCGPSCATMAMKWLDSDFNRTAEDAREDICPEGGWWYTNNIVDYIEIHGGVASYYELSDSSNIKQFIDAGGLVILCLDAHYITETDIEAYHIHKYYKSGEGSGHFIVVKGYIYSNDVLYYEVYDPWSWGAKYADGEYKGKNRYYLASDLYNAADIWWGNFIGVNGPSAEQTLSPKLRVLRAEEITHAWGGDMR